jgi:hypothetical protein
MNVNVLIDSIVRQTTVLIAQLAIAEGGRPSLAHTANQLFVELVRELKSQGLGNKVIADMFGLALRTYHGRVQRLNESATYGGRSLWEAVLEHVRSQGTLAQAQVLGRFQGDDPATVRAVLKDLVDSGLVFQTGTGTRTTYRAASDDDLSLSTHHPEAIEYLVWVAVCRFGPSTAEELRRIVPLAEASLEQALDALVDSGRIEAVIRGKSRVYQGDGCVVSLGTEAGWEAAVFDHYQALVTALVTKLRHGQRSANQDDVVGGSTYSAIVWPEHPLYDEARGQLQKLRNIAADLRRRIAEHNEGLESLPEHTERIITYLGQTLVTEEEAAFDGPQTE